MSRSGCQRMGWWYDWSLFQRTFSIVLRSAFLAQQQFGDAMDRKAGTIWYIGRNIREYIPGLRRAPGATSPSVHTDTTYCNASTDYLVMLLLFLNAYWMSAFILRICRMGVEYFIQIDQPTLKYTASCIASDKTIASARHYGCSQSTYVAKCPSSTVRLPGESLHHLPVTHHITSHDTLL